MGTLRLLLVAWAILLASQIGATEMDKTSLSDYSLRGHVRECIEQTRYSADGAIPERNSTSTFIYSPEGKLLESRTQYGSGPEYVATYTYDAAGHLTSKSVGPGESAADRFSTTYVFDDKGQLLTVKSGAESSTISYDRDDQGRKLRTEHFPVRKLEPNTAVGAIPWENSELQLLPSSGGTLTTVYDEHNRPVEGRVSDANSRVLMKIVRTYDAEGRVQGDKLITEEMESILPEQLTGQLNDAQKKALSKFAAGVFASGESGYKYDSQGRVVEKSSLSGVPGNQLTKIAYNDHGDVSDEVTVVVMSADIGTVYGFDEHDNLVPTSKSDTPGPSQGETRYVYEYDSHGNWTKKTTSVRQGQAEFKVSTVITRTLSYY